MDHIHPLSMAPALGERAGRREQCVGAGRELVELHLQALEAPQRAHLIAHEMPALGMAGVGEHVRDHQRTHDVFFQTPRRVSICKRVLATR